MELRISKIIFICDSRTIWMNQDDRKSLFPGIVDRHSCPASDGAVIVIDRQQAVCMIYHIIVTPPVIHSRGRFFFTHDYGFCTMFYQKCHAPAAALLPVCIMALKGEGYHQLDLAIFRLFFEPQQDLTRPHVHAQSAADPEVPEALLIELNQLVAYPLLDTLAAVVVLVVFETKPLRPVAGDGTDSAGHFSPSRNEYSPFYGYDIILPYPKRGYNHFVGGDRMELDYAALGERIRMIRKSKGMTQNYLAEQVGIEPSNISHIERAVSKVGLATLVGIANTLECSVDDLLCDSLTYEREAFESQLVEISRDCTPKELRMLTDLAWAMKVSMRKRGYDI